MSDQKIEYAHQLLTDYFDDHEADTDQRIVWAISCLEGDPNAIEAMRRLQKKETS